MQWPIYLQEKLMRELEVQAQDCDCTKRLYKTEPTRVLQC